MRKLTAGLLISVIISFPVSANAQRSSFGQEATWRQIIVMRSTRSDVEQLMGKRDVYAHMVDYDLPDARVSIEYADGENCHFDWHDVWNVAEWVVVEVTYSPDNEVKFSSLGIKLDGLRVTRESPHVPDLWTYVDDARGVKYTIDADDDFLNSVAFVPGSKYDNLRCDAGYERLEPFQSESPVQ